MSTAENILWIIAAALWIIWAAWLISDAIEDTRFGDLIERIWHGIATPINRTINWATARLTATRRKKP